MFARLKIKEVMHLNDLALKGLNHSPLRSNAAASKAEPVAEKRRLKNLVTRSK